MTTEVTLAQFGIAFALGFILGGILGWVVGRATSKSKLTNWERSLISIVVLAVWVISVLADIAIESYQTPTMVHTKMGLVAGYFFEQSIKNFFTRKGDESADGK